MNDVFDKIFEKHKEKRKNKKKEQRGLSDRISREFQENTISILKIGDLIFEDENKYKSYFIEIAISHKHNEMKEEKIKEIFKNLRKEDLIDTYEKQDITHYTLRVK